jgi:hypothetical protein
LCPTYGGVVQFPHVLPALRRTAEWRRLQYLQSQEEYSISKSGFGCVQSETGFQLASSDEAIERETQNWIPEQWKSIPENKSAG